MTRYEIRILPTALKELDAIEPRAMRRRIAERIASLATVPLPPGVEKLAGTKRATYRIRQGTYRIVYRVENESLIVEVIKIGHRREIYR